MWHRHRNLRQRESNHLVSSGGRVLTLAISPRPGPIPPPALSGRQPSAARILDGLAEGIIYGGRHA